MRRESRLPAKEAASTQLEAIDWEEDQDQFNATVDAAAIAPNDDFRNWLNERLDNPDRYNLYAELLQAAGRWSA
jgi:hypothetical protein